MQAGEAGGADDSRRCLIVDDDAPLRALLRRVMEADGFACEEATTGLDGLRKLRANPVPLVLADFHMPEMDGGEMLKVIRVQFPDTAVVMVTAVTDVQMAVRCLDAGALDYVTKPFAIDEVRARVKQALEKRRLLIENRAYRSRLEEKVAIQARKHEELFLASLQSLTEALEVKDAYTWGHSTRVTRYAVAIAQEMDVPADFLAQVELGSRLHDIGKIGVRESVLNKDGALSAEEYDHVMEHPVIGWRLLEPLLREMPHALAVVRSHHERFDGQGSPDAMRGDGIPLEARIAAVADAFDAMTSGRVYRPGITADQALLELHRCAGTQFDPTCVAAFERVLESFDESRADVAPWRPTTVPQ